MISASISAVYEIVDTFWLSRLGPAALSTPTVSWPYRGVLMSLVFGVSASASSLVGQYVGARDYRMASRSAGTVLGVLLAILVPGSLAFMALEGYYAGLTHLPPDIRPLALQYLTVLLAVTPLSGINILFFTTMGAIGDTRTPMKLSLFSTLLNFVLDPVLIFWAHLGVLGAALATGLSIAASAGYALYSFATGRHGVRIGLGDLLPDRSLLPLVFRVSTPVIAQQLGTSLGFVVMIRVVSGLGTPVVAAYSIGQVILSFDRVIVMPVSRATSIIVSQALGAGLRQRALEAARRGLGLIMLSSGSYVALLLGISRYFIAVFTHDPYTFQAATRMLLIFGPSIVFFGVFMLANSIARGSGHTLFMAAVGLSRLWLLRIPLSWLLAYTLRLGDTGLWAGMATSNYAAGLLGAGWTLRGGWAEAIIRRARPKPLEARAQGGGR
ncbi:MAG: MATE family efflux transporter, partial [Desulfurococcales archaeon]|nr:MATE family efflux transporter [Desulfurococcales archaeon]